MKRMKETNQNLIYYKLSLSFPNNKDLSTSKLDHSPPTTILPEPKRFQKSIQVKQQLSSEIHKLHISMPKKLMKIHRNKRKKVPVVRIKAAR